MNSAPAKFSSYQKLVVGLLAFLQFTVILDFMILSPLGALIMPALQITPSQFGFVVSAYAFSAGAAGILAAGFADRYDRKRLLLFFYTGFVLGTLFCGIAPNYPFLLAARMITGLFGGVLGSIVMAIATDLFPMDMRGRVIGILQSAFAASQILGIPAGLFFSNYWGWHAPFLMIVGVSTIAGWVIWRHLKPVTAHLTRRTDKNPFHHLIDTVRTPSYLLAFAVTGLMSIGGFMLMPFSSAFTVNNIGIHVEQLPMMYLIIGLCTMTVGPVIGRVSDRFGKFPVFVFGVIMTIVMVLIYTRLGISSLTTVIVVNSIMFFAIFSRMIPAQALMSAIPSPDKRGSFMAISASLQQVAGGIASVAAGLIVSQSADGKLEHFEQVGHVVCGTTFITLILMIFVNRRVNEKMARP